MRNIILEAVQPGIRESLKAYKLGGFKMDKISLGTMVLLKITFFLQSSAFSILFFSMLVFLTSFAAQPFRVGGVKVYDKNVSRNEIVMDMDIW